MTIERKTYNGVTRYLVRLPDLNPDPEKETKQPRRTIGIFDTRRQAEAAQERELENRAAGLTVIPEPSKAVISFAAFVDEVYLPSVTGSHRTKSDYKGACKHLKAFFGDMPLIQITNIDVQRFLAEFETRMKANGTEVRRSDNHRRKVAQRLRQVFNVAVEEGYIPASAHPYRADASKRNRLPRRKKDTTRAVLKYEVATEILRLLKSQSVNTVSSEPNDLLPHVAEYWYYLLGTALCTGLRRSELLGLTVSDLDLSKRTVLVSRQYGWMPDSTDQETKYPTLKTENSIRSVPLTKEDFELVLYWATHMRTSQSPDDLVFPRPIVRGSDVWGYWDSESFFSNSYKKVMQWAARTYFKQLEDDKTVSLPHSWDDFDATMHQWRHTFAVFNLTQAQVDINTLSHWLGHHSPAFTYEQYSRYVDGQSASAVERIAAAKGYGRGGEQQVGLADIE